MTFLLLAIVVVAIAAAVFVVGRRLRPASPFPVLRGRTLDHVAAAHGARRRLLETDGAFRARIDRARSPRRGTASDLRERLLDVPGVRGVTVETVGLGHVCVVVRVAWWRRKRTVMPMARRVAAERSPMHVVVDVEAA